MNGADGASHRPATRTSASRYVVQWLLVAVAATALTAAVWDSLLLYVWWFIAPGLAVAGVLVGIRRNKPQPALPWNVVLTSLVLLWAGWSLSAFAGAELADVSTLEAATLIRDAIYAIAYPLLGVGAWLIVRARTAGRDPNGAIDALIIMLALALVLGSSLFGRSAAVDVGLLDRFWIRIAPLILAAVVTACIRILMLAAHRALAAWLLFVGAALTLAGNLWTAQLLRQGEPTQILEIDVLWIAAYVAVTAAALHPTMADVVRPAPEEALVEGLPLDRLLIIGAALILTPVVHLRVADDTLEGLLVTSGGVAITLLVVWRFVGLLRDRDTARATLQIVAARDAAIATIARRALAEQNIDTLFVDTVRLLNDALPDGHFQITTIEGSDRVQEPNVLDAVIDDGDGPVARLTARGSDDPGEQPGQEQFVNVVAALLSTAARRRAAEQNLEHAALHDELTGVANRTLALDRLRLELARRDGHSVAVAFIDLDGFKIINDTSGHEAGDEVLRRVAQNITAAVRPEDTVARIAGDEFVVIVPAAHAVDLEDLLDRLRTAVNFEFTHGADRHEVAASVGIALGQPGTSTADGVISAADTAMYRDKASKVANDTR